MHDPLTGACLVERRFVQTTIDPLDDHDAEIVTSVDGDAFRDFWLGRCSAERRRSRD